VSPKKDQHYQDPEASDEGKVQTVESTRQPDVGEKRPRDEESEQPMQDPALDSLSTTRIPNGPSMTTNGSTGINANSNYGSSGNIQMMDGMGVGGGDALYIGDLQWVRLSRRSSSCSLLFSETLLVCFFPAVDD
jgi:hypothetical protein